MFYPYPERMSKLKQIFQIENREERAEKLQDFINDELKILNGLQPPASRSHALDLARLKLKQIREEQAKDDLGSIKNEGVVRNLFGQN